MIAWEYGRCVGQTGELWKDFVDGFTMLNWSVNLERRTK